MSVTRHALRVYTALTELRQSRGDVLDALIPFFEPILEVMDGKFFDPRLFALGVRRLLRWRFTKDIAEQFIPRLERHGYLQRSGTVRAGAYTVRYRSPDETSSNLPIDDILTKILDEFERFVPTVTDLRNYTPSRDELTEFLVRFLVSMDAYGQADLLQEIERLQQDQEAQSVLAKLDEGGSPLTDEDRYMCARFVRYICAKEPQYVEHLARLASIGLLTEVVEDFIKPTQTAAQVGLTVVLDASIALDLLGCSGKALQEDVKNVTDSLSAIGCKFVVFPITCLEMRANLETMLSKPANERYGYTFDAMVRREVMEGFVRAVAHDPERALSRIGINVKPITLQQFPNLHVHFDDKFYEDFFASVRWVQEVAPREHDATCMALLMRLREGKQHSDIFRCGYVFVTRNPAFVRESRRYCLQSRLLTELQEGPVVHQRELATTAWLRTGLGANEQIPRGHLLATCDRVLRVRNEVREAVANKLRQVTPEKLEQYELLLLDQRSLRKLGDETLNDETIVTAENAEHLLEVMRLATVEEERQQFDQQRQVLEQRIQEHTELAAKTAAANRLEAEKLVFERDRAHALIVQRRMDDIQHVKKIISGMNQTFRRIDQFSTFGLLGIGTLAVADYFLGWLSGSYIWIGIGAIAGLIGLYHKIMTVLEKPKIGVATILTLTSRAWLRRKLSQANLLDAFPIECFELNAGQISSKFEDTHNKEERAISTAGSDNPSAG